MTLKEFLDMWVYPNRTVIICDISDYDDMYDTVTEIYDGVKTVKDLANYTNIAIIPELSETQATYYLTKDMPESIVKRFFTGEDYIIVWINYEDTLLSPYRGDTYEKTK